MAFLELVGVNKGFLRRGRRTEVLRDVSLEMSRGEFVAVVGYSGSGKTTLLSILAGLLAPDTGGLVIDGRPVTGPGLDRGVVFQNYSLLPWLSVYDNVALTVEQAFPAWSAERSRAHTERHIAMVGLTEAREKRPAQLSGGMRQRVAVARALAMDPTVLLMDEPLGALDALTRATLQDEIARLWAADRKTVVMVTNDVDEAILLADRIVPLVGGPPGTLGRPLPVDLPRPRSRKLLGRDLRFKRLRLDVIEALQAGARARPGGPTTPPLALVSAARPAVPTPRAART
jgi:nitrate/nitrite transport system ATP-binding protein